MGRGKAFDPNRFFIICLNSLGSPYGSASPVTINTDTGKPYGPEFPQTTIRDDVRWVFTYELLLFTIPLTHELPFLRIQKLVLDHLGVTSVAIVIGGSMGGMAVLEWPLCTPKGFIRHILPIATSARHSAWCISWGEAQRQSIYSDPSYEDGYYTAQPASGLAAARMAALLTYRSRDSFESRFGRKAQQSIMGAALTPPLSPALSVSEDPLSDHNDGLRNAKIRSSTHSPSGSPDPSRPLSPTPKKPIFSAQSYLRYQGEKFTSRFDANCYIHITRKLDTHDVARGRLLHPGEDENAALARVLSTEPPRTIVIGIQTDGLFTPNEQGEIADHIPGAELIIIPSPEGHDGFLLEFEIINSHIMKFLKREFPTYYETVVDDGTPTEGFEIKKTSLFGEAEADLTRW